MNNYQYIKDALEKENKSISELAKQVNVSKGYLSRLINNKINEPGSTKINAIHHALNLPTLQESFEKKAYLVNVDTISIEKYVYIASHNIASTSDIYILVKDKAKIKDVKKSLNRFYDYLNFSNTKIDIVTESDLKKVISKSGYTSFYTFNNEFEEFNLKEFTDINLEEKEYLRIKRLKNKSVLLISNNQSKLSILLNVLKLTTDYAIDDFAIFKDFNTQSGTFLSNQVHIIEQISKQRQNNRLYFVGNEFIYFADDTALSDTNNALINATTYLKLFDLVLNVTFKDDERNDKIQLQKNTKLAKNLKKGYVNLDGSIETRQLATIIIETVEEFIDEN
ncbi:helix-turn-helix domain-containing protein [Mycoplasma sp. P36-A1]|uniref:helix-turn-helix domain-containing protein n=1 Tax=Mycoplasma sp. P36-A1 TaxID=3252900 RepID=UPI003C2D72DF